MIILLAALDILAVVPGVLCGLSVGLLAWWIFAALSAEELAQEDEWRYDITRINALCKVDPVYRVFRFAIPTLAKLNRALMGERLPEAQRQILAAGLTRYWIAEEYLAKAQIVSVLLLPAYAVVCVLMLGPVGMVLAVFLSLLTAWLLRVRLARLAERRVINIKRRLPFLLDLLTLLTEAGSSFLQALEQAVREFQGHDVAVEFGRVLNDLKMGKARSEAFDSMRVRLNDDEVGSIIGAMIQSEHLGTPLSSVLRSQAEVLRLRRSQRAETIAGEAGIRMLLPGILVMASTILIILGPFLLNFFYIGLGL